jgi:predicted nucleic acid-binding Zn ribbon protein
MLRAECQKCGHIAEIRRELTDAQRQWLVCSQCGAKGPVVTEKEVVRPFASGYVPTSARKPTDP